MSDLHAQLEKYDEMIAALQKFNNDAMETAENMTNQADLCVNVMGGDKLSENSAEKVKESIKKLRALITDSTELQKALVSEREAIVELIRQSENMED